jgi:hypothetical protein
MRDGKSSPTNQNSVSKPTTLGHQSRPPQRPLQTDSSPKARSLPKMIPLTVKHKNFTQCKTGRNRKTYKRRAG